MNKPKSKEAETLEEACSKESRFYNALNGQERIVYMTGAKFGAQWQSTSLTTALKERDDEIEIMVGVGTADTIRIKQLEELVKERDDKIKRLRELFNIVFNIDGMTTSEFCAEYLIELPSWRGDVLLAASEFIRIDAIKWKMVKDSAKEIWNTPIALTTQNGKD